MRSGFKNISEATGLILADEISVSFISSENQQHELKIYFNDLSHQIDKLQKSNETINQEIEELINHKKTS